MNLVKWLRKNNKKVMAVVVIVILFMFIGGGTFIKTLQEKQSNRALATYADGRRFSVRDLTQSRQELDILGMLGMDRFLQVQNLSGLLLSELLFSERRPSPGAVEQFGQLIRQNQLRITQTDIAKIYEGKEAPYVYWFLLKRESERAGIAVPADVVKQMLGQVIPQIFQGRTYAQLMGSVLNQVHLPEQSVLQVAARLVAVLQYAQVLCQAEDITTAEVRHIASTAMETVDINAVVVEATPFLPLVDTNDVLTEAALQQQFTRYRNVLPGTVTADNPHGFGYKFPARVQVQYLLLALDEVLAQIDTPTEEEREEYYRRHVEQLYTTRSLADPNDPNSEQTQVRSYAEVAADIAKRVVAEKALVRAESVLQDAKTLADLPLSGDGTDEGDLEQRSRRAVPYADVAAQIRTQHGITLRVGETGLLTLRALSEDPVLGRLGLRGRGPYPIALARVLFTADPINQTDLQLLTMQRIRPYDSIGPLRHRWIQQNPTSLTGLTMGLVRIVRAATAESPTGLDARVDRTTARLAGDDPNTPRDTFTLRTRVAEDLRNLAALGLARQATARLVEQAGVQGWDKALAQMNREVASQLSLADPNLFAIQTLKDLSRLQPGQSYFMQQQAQEGGLAMDQLRDLMGRSLLADRAYQLVPAEATRTEDPCLLVSEAENRVYGIKDVSLKRLPLEEFQTLRGRVLYSEGLSRAQSLAATHFDPQSILTRNQYVSLRDRDREDPNEAK